MRGNGMEKEDKDP